MKLNSIVYIVFFIIIISFYFLIRFSNTSIHPISEGIPRLEEIINSTISYNISADLEIKLYIEELPFILILTGNCNFLYLTNNVSVSKCEDTYTKKEGNSTIFCIKSGDEWDCKRSLEPSISNIYNNVIYVDYVHDTDGPNGLLNYVLNNFNYTAIKSWKDKFNRISVYCYNVTFYGYDKEEEVNITGNVVSCFDKQTRFLVNLEMKMITKNRITEGSNYTFYYKYEVKKLVVNPRYEEYLSMLNLPGKVKVDVERLYVIVYNNSLNILMDTINDLGISENVEEVILYTSYNNYTIKGCIEKENYLTCSINKTIEEFIRIYEPSIKMNTKNYEIKAYRTKIKYIFEKIGRLIKIEGFSKDIFPHYLIICYDKDWNVSKRACQGYKYGWEGDYVSLIDSPFSDIVNVNETIKKMVIVITSSSEPWTINVYERNRLIKTCYNVTEKTPCTVYLS